MEAEKIRIQLKIINKLIELWIKPEHEHYYREVEKRINEKASNFAKKWTFQDPEDLLTKLLIELMLNYIAKEEKLNAYEAELLPKMVSLNSLSQQVSDLISQMEKTEP